MRSKLDQLLRGGDAKGLVMTETLLVLPWLMLMIGMLIAMTVWMVRLDLALTAAWWRERAHASGGDAAGVVRRMMGSDAAILSHVVIAMPTWSFEPYPCGDNNVVGMEAMCQ